MKRSSPKENDDQLRKKAAAATGTSIHESSVQWASDQADLDFWESWTPTRAIAALAVIKAAREHMLNATDSWHDSDLTNTIAEWDNLP